VIRRPNLFSRTSHVHFFVCLGIVCALAACGGGRRGDATAYEEPRDRGQRIGSLFIPAPVLRVGLVDKGADVVTLDAAGGLLLIDAVTGDRVVDDPLAHVSFFARGAARGGSGVRYRVQVASVADRGAAEKLAADLRASLGEPVVAVWNSQTSTWRVQAGEASTREEAAKIESRLRALGHVELWTVSEKYAGELAGTVVAVDRGGEQIGEAKRFHCIPARAGDFVRLGDSSWRGAVELRVSTQGGILPVNIVNLEDYLRGVLPAEMSPSVYPQLEALKAQVLAARTYAVRNRGQYAREGFDICNTAACQVYGGAGIEMPMADQAVRETAGEVITYAGAPINALFTSTCGGHTEDVENIFKGEAAPYLRGVLCIPEAESFSRLETAEQPGITYGSDGLPVDFDLALLRIAGIIGADSLIAPRERFDNILFTQALARLASRLGWKNFLAGDAAAGPVSLVSAINRIVDTADWRARIDRTVLAHDLDAVLDSESLAALDDRSRRNIVHFLRLGYLAPDADGGLPAAEAMDGTRFLRMFSAILQREGGGVVDGLLLARSGASMRIQRSGGEEEYPVADGMKLFRRFGSAVVPMRRLHIAGGDRVALVLRTGAVAAVVHTPPMEGLTNDRFSRYLNWEITLTQAELDEKVKRYADVGSVRELNPLRYGVSERIVELEVVGDGGRSILKGLQVRWALGLRENLFVIDRSYDELGAVRAWRFIGRGWGHGVGLCQVGAYGMALAGATYRVIVQHYYSGVEIEPMR
jgi:stage II sporulation protein D